MSEAKRRSPRYATNVAVSWIVGKQARLMTGLNANMNGLFLRTDEPVTPGGLMQIQIALPDGPQRFIVVARFVGNSVDGRGVGVEIFVGAEPARRAWTRFVQSLARTVQVAPLLRAIAV